MAISNFSGGMNNRLNPIKILDNQGVIYDNINILSGCLESLKGNKEISDASDAQPFCFKEKWSFSPQGTSFANLLGLAYRAYNNNLEKTLDGKEWVNLFIQPPVEAPVVVNGDTVDEDDSTKGFYGSDIMYCYTYYCSADGAESAPSSYSEAMKIGSVSDEGGTNESWVKGSAKVSVIASTDPQVDRIKIYRMGGGITNWQEAVEVDNKTETFIDTTPNDNLGDQLTTIGYIEAPAVSYLCAYYALLFGVSKDRSNIMYFSNEANPLVWDPLNYILFDEPVVGLGSSSLGLLVFTEYRVYIIYGTSPSEFQRYLLYDNVGCVSHNSIQSYKGAVIWQSNDGIYIFDGSNCTNLTMMAVEPFSNKIISSCFSDECYYGLLDSGDILTIDFKYESRPVMMIRDQYEGLHAAFHKVYGVKEGKLYEIATGDQRTLHWKSKAFNDDSVTVLKNYKYIQVYCKGDFVFKIYTDDRLAASVQLKEGYNEIKLQQDLRLGYYIQFEVVGVGSIFEIVYTMESRLQARGI